MPERLMLHLTKIRIDMGTQVRKIRPEVVEDYTEKVARGVQFPPVVVFEDESGNRILAAGWHRYKSYEKAGRTAIPVDLRKGTLEDALLFAVADNQEHGAQRTAEDKKDAVLALLAQPKWTNCSDRWVADKCGVSHPFVAKVRSEKPQANGTHEVKEAAKDETESIGNVSNRNTDEKETEVRTGRDGKKRIPKSEAPKNGEAPWDWKAFETSFGALVREIDRLGGAYKKKTSEEASALRKQLGEFKAAMIAWQKELAGA